MDRRSTSADNSNSVVWSVSAGVQCVGLNQGYQVKTRTWVVDSRTYRQNTTSLIRRDLELYQQMPVSRGYVRVNVSTFLELHKSAGVLM